MDRKSNFIPEINKYLVISPLVWIRYHFPGHLSQTFGSHQLGIVLNFEKKLYILTFSSFHFRKHTKSFTMSCIKLSTLFNTWLPIQILENTVHSSYILQMFGQFLETLRIAGHGIKYYILGIISNYPPGTPCIRVGTSPVVTMQTILLSQRTLRPAFYHPY